MCTILIFLLSCIILGAYTQAHHTHTQYKWSTSRLFCIVVVRSFSKFFCCLIFALLLLYVNFCCVPSFLVRSASVCVAFYLLFYNYMRFTIGLAFLLLFIYHFLFRRLRKSARVCVCAMQSTCPVWYLIKCNACLCLGFKKKKQSRIKGRKLNKILAHNINIISHCSLGSSRPLPIPVQLQCTPAANLKGSRYKQNETKTKMKTSA